MGAPAIAVAAANSRPGRRILIVVFVVLALIGGFFTFPLAMIPFALVGTAVGGSATAAEAVGAPAFNGEWGYPLKGRYFKGRGYGHHPIAGCGYCSVDHKGYDMGQECGATIYAAVPGRVLTAGSYYGYGNAVRIKSAGGIQIIYGHMQWGSLRVHVGDRVTAGTPLGAEGNTGRSFGCHLHFEVRVHGASVDPEPFMAAHGLPLK